MTSIKSNFSSSQNTPDNPGTPPTQPAKQQQQSTPPTSSSPGTPATEVSEESEPYFPAKPKDSSSSFFSSLSRRLSSGQSQNGGVIKGQGGGYICPRRVLNVDPNRERCVVPEMDSNKLRRVSFCVDVEIAGGPRYRDDEEEDDEERKRKKKEFKMKEKAEGAALKNPEVLAQEKDEQGEPELEQKSNSLHTRAKDSVSSTARSQKRDAEENAAAATGATEEERDSASRKKEKKQRSEAERKDRKEKRRRRAEDSGAVPVEVMLEGNEEDSTAGAQAPSSLQSQTNGTTVQKTPIQPQPNALKQDRPTTDPARIYRRCCQLRESPILKRITEQLSRAECILPQNPGVVNCLDLTGSRLQLADVVSLGDWLAVVPVRHLKLEDADLNDEGVRCILAGLLAAKKPESTKRKSTTPRHRQGLSPIPHKERAGVVQRLTFKNNPRISRVGWKHISLFIYMCRSLRAIDISMNQFPENLPPSAQGTPAKIATSQVSNKAGEVDAAEVFYQCLSQRPGGSRLEELILSECGLGSKQIRKVVDGAVVCGISRLGLAGNHIDDEGLEHVLQYLRSGVCQALDLGGNDLRGKVDTIADALVSKADLPCWGFSFADCNLDSASLKPFFAAIVKLPSFRFLDLSHNRDLCSEDNGLISLLRRYIGRLDDLKRLHLLDVNMSPKQAIALADVLPEGPRLAHLNLLENPQLTALANAKSETDQEEACALYASLMAAVRVSSTIFCVDIDVSVSNLGTDMIRIDCCVTQVPSPDNSEVVKALAKQIVAYSLRNMEQFAIAEATGNENSAANATAALTKPHGGEKGLKEFTVPDVLTHLVGNADGVSESHNSDGPAPDDDYIVGGTGVVKALQYVLGEKANDSKRLSIPSASGNVTPGGRPDSSAGYIEPGKAKKMSINLLDSARKIRSRLQPALLKESSGSDEIAYRRLLFLDQTLQSMIQRFEEEYPETRLASPSSAEPASVASSLTEQPSVLTATTQPTEPSTTATVSDEEEMFDADEYGPNSAPITSRRTSDGAVAGQIASSRDQNLEEGRLHRLGQRLRRDIIDSPQQQGPSTLPTSSSSSSAHQQQKQHSAADAQRLKELSERLENVEGAEWRAMVAEQGWDETLRRFGASYEDLRSLQEQDPESWELFKDSQMKARLNVEGQSQRGM